jgi:hypothetical protein
MLLNKKLIKRGEAFMSTKKVALVFVCLLASGCSTPYQELTIFAGSGGWKVANVEGDVYRVSFSANGYSTRETAQTYWLYRCSDLALEKGFGGFEILSNINLSLPNGVQIPTLSGAPSPVKVSGGGGFVYVPTYSNDSNKPLVEADIRLLPAPISEVPPKIFDAQKLKAALDARVNGEKCSMGNVCPHVHKYLFPEGKFDKPGT